MRIETKYETSTNAILIMGTEDSALISKITSETAIKLITMSATMSVCQFIVVLTTMHVEETFAIQNKLV